MADILGSEFVVEGMVEEEEEEEDGLAITEDKNKIENPIKNKKN